MRLLLIALGALFVGLGVLGIFLPLLPTTPFLLLAAACFARSSDRFYAWLMEHRWLGEYIRNYREGRGMSHTSKIVTLIALWTTIGYSAFRGVSLVWLRLVMLSIALAVTIHISSIPTHTTLIRDESVTERTNSDAHQPKNEIRRT